MRKTNFRIRTLCPCGFFLGTPHSGNSFFLDVVICPRCAAPRDDWHEIALRWVDLGKWWSPRTWHSGYWEDPDGQVYFEFDGRLVKKVGS